MKKIIIGTVLMLFILGILVNQHLRYSIGYMLFLNNCEEINCLLDVVPVEKVLSAPDLVSSTTVEFSGIQLQVPTGGTVEQLDTGGKTIRYGERRLLIIDTLPEFYESAADSALFRASEPASSSYDYLTAIYTVTPADFKHVSSLEEKQIITARLTAKSTFLVANELYKIRTESLEGYLTEGEVVNAEINVGGVGYMLTFIGFTEPEYAAVLQSIQ